MLEAVPWHKVHLSLQVQCSARVTPVVFGVSTEREAGGRGSREEVLPVSGLEWVSMFHGSIPGAFQAGLSTFLRDRSSSQLRTHVGNIQARAAAPPSSVPV